MMKGASIVIALHLSLPPIGSCDAQSPSGAEAIRLNQVGYHPRSEKVAIVAYTRATTFVIVSVSGADTVLRGPLAAPERWEPSGEEVRRADFSQLRRPGRYVMVVPGIGPSHPFQVDTSSIREVARAAIKGFYFQRASTPLLPEHAGAWSRTAGHPDDSVVVHPSAASTARPAGSVISAPGGWYDAGDYNKYIVNSGITMYTLLAILEHYSDYAARLETQIPESNDTIPDIVDEALWNLRWMLQMQDPSDGGVYHKLTNPEFDGMVMPDRARGVRYVVQKSTAATLDFAAVAAHASRVLVRYGQLRGLSDSLLHASRSAWSWAQQHPDSIYDQERLNARFAPKVNTGAYGGRTLSDERRWAATELYLTTRDTAFLAAAEPFADPPADVPDWGSVRTLGLISMVQDRSRLPNELSTRAAQRLTNLARSLVERRRTSAYGVSMAAGDFVWGSNAVAANQGMVLLQAYRLTRDTSYLNAAAANLDYILGRNATGYSFVTGFGSKRAMFPHHRPSVADTVVAPVPGLLIGGPNPRQQDRCPGYPSSLPALSYVDAVCSYASNEIAINWNAPLAYLAVGVDSEMRSIADR